MQVWLKVVGAIFAVATIALTWKEAAREAPPDPEKEARRVEMQAARIKKCLELPGEVDITIDAWGDFAGCTVKAKREGKTQ